jgi:hypothetical protein
MLRLHDNPRIGLSPTMPPNKVKGPPCGSDPRSCVAFWREGRWRPPSATSRQRVHRTASKVERPAQAPDRARTAAEDVGGLHPRQLPIDRSKNHFHAPQRRASRPWPPARRPFLPRAAVRAPGDQLTYPQHFVASGLDGLQVACYRRFGGRPCLSKERCRL